MVGFVRPRAKGHEIGVRRATLAPGMGGHKGLHNHEGKTLLHSNTCYTRYTYYTCYTCYTPTASLQQLHRQRAMTGLPPAGILSGGQVTLGYRWRRIGTRATF